MANRNGAQGARFENSLVPFTCTYWPDTVALGKQGRFDKGDLHMPGNGLYIVEAKSSTAYKNLEEWWREAEVEKGNKGVPHGIVVHKRKGKGQAADQWATMTYLTFMELLHGDRG